MNLSPKLLLAIINKAKENIKESDTYREICDDFDLDYDAIDLVPVKFADIYVSGKTDAGIITLNLSILNKKDMAEVEHLLVHEFYHVVSQCEAPTRSADDGDYLSNPDEFSAFQHQVKYLDEEEDPEAAEDYVEQVLDHHEEKGKERKDKKENLMLLVD